MANFVSLPPQVRTAPVSDSASLVAQLTGMSGFERDLIFELFPSLSTLSKAVREQAGRNILEDHFGEEPQWAITEFLMADCVVDRA